MGGTKQGCATASPEPESSARSSCFRRILRSRYTLFLFAFGCIVLYSWRPLLSPDSVHYVDVARTIAAEGHAATYHLQVSANRVPDTDLMWPPGYPFLLSLCIRMGWGIDVSTSIVSVVSYTVVVALLLLVVRKPAWALVGTLMWLQLIQGTEVVLWAWSEGPFFALLVGAMLAQGFAASGGWARLLSLSCLAGVLGGSAFLVRYVGVSIIPAFLLGGVILGVVHRRDRTARSMAVVAGAEAAFVASVFVLLWMWRSSAVNGSWLGPDRAPSIYSTGQIVWALTLALSKGLALILPLLVLGTMGRPDTHLTSHSDALYARGARLGAAATYLLVWTVMYIGLMLWQQATIRLTPLDQRYMFPTYGAGMFMTALVLERSYHVTQGQLQRLRLLGYVMAAVLLLLGARALRPDTPPAPVYEWIRDNTPEHALLIGHGIWQFRYETGRPVLESGAYCEGNKALEGSEVLAFLRRHGHKFPALYLVVGETDLAAATASYGAAGIKLKLVHVDSALDRPQNPRILQVQTWPPGER